MKTIRLSLIALLVIGWASLASAQTSMTTTTLAANQTATDQFMTVTSATGFTVGNYVWVDSEQQLIVSVTGTRIGVRRGQNGTRTAAHDNTDRVYTGASDHFHTNDPDYGADCTRGTGQAAFTPWLNVREGFLWYCRAETSTWMGTSAATVVFDSRPVTF